MIHLSAIASVFPYDPKTDSVLGHQHLIIAYALTWCVQLCYLFYVGRRFYLAKRQKR